MDENRKLTRRSLRIIAGCPDAQGLSVHSPKRQLIHIGETKSLGSAPSLPRGLAVLMGESDTNPL